jgi:DNA-binding NarL/FixJ family response regulator
MLLDLQMPRMGGFECLDEVRRRWPKVAVVVLTVNEDQETPLEVMRRGASAYVPKYVRPSDLASIVRQVMSRSVLVGAPPLNPLPEVPEADGRRNSFGLTDRELEVLALVSVGKTNEDVAHVLFVSTKTVKFHLSGIFRKLRVRNRTEAAALAISHGLVNLGSLED